MNGGVRIVTLTQGRSVSKNRQTTVKRVERSSDTRALARYLELLRQQNREIVAYLPQPLKQAGVDLDKIAALNRDIVIAFRRTRICLNLCYAIGSFVDKYFFSKDWMQSVVIALDAQEAYLALNFMYRMDARPVVCDSAGESLLPVADLNTDILMSTLIGPQSFVINALANRFGISQSWLNAAVDLARKGMETTDKQSMQGDDISGVNLSDIPSVNSGFARFFKMIGDSIYSLGIRRRDGVTHVVDATVGSGVPLGKPTTAAAGPAPKSTTGSTARSTTGSTGGGPPPDQTKPLIDLDSED